ncbi:hypothetical protein HYDPIDRAFT_27313 [Hydnomerulius pinastri MD-312]|nr:hypothetical protein HYDPIDRAFT_27313 [Hydnomerulius pinastri MD-312]
MTTLPNLLFTGSQVPNTQFHAGPQQPPPSPPPRAQAPPQAHNPLSPHPVIWGHFFDPSHQFPIPVFENQGSGYSARFETANHPDSPSSMESVDAPIPPHHRPVRPFVPPAYASLGLNLPQSGAHQGDQQQGFAYPAQQNASTSSQVPPLRNPPHHHHPHAHLGDPHFSGSIPTQPVLPFGDATEWVMWNGVPSFIPPFSAAALAQHLPTPDLNAAGPASEPTILIDAPQPMHPLTNILDGVDPHGQPVTLSPDNAGPASVEDSSPSQGAGDRVSTSQISVEEIFTEEIRPTCGESPPPRPKLRLWDLADEYNSLGLQDGDVITTTMVGGVRVLSVKRSPTRKNTTISTESGSSGVSKMSLLGLPGLVPQDKAEKQEVREEMRKMLMAASASQTSGGLGASIEDLPEEELVRREPKGKERDVYNSKRQEPRGKEPKDAFLQAPTQSLSQPSPHPEDVTQEHVQFSSSNRSKDDSRERQSTDESINSLLVTIIPPTTVGSSNNSINMLSPPPHSQATSRKNTPAPPYSVLRSEMPQTLATPETLKSILKSPKPLQREAPAQTQAPTQTEYLTPETLLDSPRSRPPLFVHTAEAGPSRLNTPAEQIRIDYLSQAYGRGRSPGTGSTSHLTPEGTYVERPWSRVGSSMMGGTPLDKGSSTVVATPSPGKPALIMSPEEMSDILPGAQNLPGKNQSWRDEQPYFNAPSPKNSLLLRGSDEDPPNTPEEEQAKAAKSRHARKTSAKTEEEPEVDLKYHLGVLARRCLIDANRMNEAFTKCDTLSPETLASAKAAYCELMTALRASLEPLNRDVDMNIDESDHSQLSWRDRYEDTVAGFQRALNRVSVLIDQFPRGDQVRRHIATTSAITKRLNYLIPKLEDAMDRVTYLRLSSQLKAKTATLRNAKTTEEARRGAYKAYFDKRRTETEVIRLRLVQMNAQRRSDGSSDESGLESADDRMSGHVLN